MARTKTRCLVFTRTSLRNKRSFNTVTSGCNRRKEREDFRKGKYECDTAFASEVFAALHQLAV